MNASKICSSVAAALLVLVSEVGAGELVTYRDGAVELEGYLSTPGGDGKPTKGVLIVHDWSGMGDYAKRRADELAALGYAAFAVDIYGKGVRPEASADRAAEAGKYRAEPALFRQRLRAGLAEMRALTGLADDRIVAIGYCFGGGGILELARDGSDVAGVVSFHGSLKTAAPAGEGSIETPVLVLHGADDPMVPPGEVAAFEDEMRKSGADWQLISYGGAVHSFSKREAGDDVASGNAYNAEADQRSWGHMLQFFEEVLGKDEG